MEHSRNLIYRALYVFGFDKFYDGPTANRVFLYTFWFILIVNNIILLHLTCLWSILDPKTNFIDKILNLSTLFGVFLTDWQYWIVASRADDIQFI